MHTYVDVVFNLPLDKAFTYNIPKHMLNESLFGKCVLVPFKNKNVKAFVVNEHNAKPRFECKDLIEILDDIPCFNEVSLDWARWICSYYLCSLGEALALFSPKIVKRVRKKKQNKEDDIKLNQGLEGNGFHKLNHEQSMALKRVIESIEKSSFKAYLLLGVTGSGKTEVYKYIAKQVIEKGKQALILVPEIALTPQLIDNFKSSFDKNRIAVLHSRIGAGQRYLNWRKIKESKIDIILGARSAIFSVEATDLGVIIIDEEHEAYYKSQDTPRYHARQVAFKIAQTTKIPLVLGSATPSIETYYHAINKNIELIHLKERHSSHQTQNVEFVDMKSQKTKSFISALLMRKINDRLSKGEQVIIFLNKRGHSPVLMCKECGYSVSCPNCDISLTYHKHSNKMLCHYCGYSKGITDCASCNSTNITMLGYGTEKVVETLKSIFRGARIARLDFDSTRGASGHEKILNDVKAKRIDILIGTQMVAKGLHFPDVTLVGILLADESLNFPDFRASERTFSLITQLIGRSGRGDIKGEVIIQTYIPDNNVMQSAKNQDYIGFYEKEIKDREKFFYPPFSRILRFVIRGRDEEKVIKQSEVLSEYIKSILSSSSSRERGAIKVLGPSVAPMGKINNNFRWQIILKSKRQRYLNDVANAAKGIKQIRGVYIEIDVDSNNLM